MNEQKSSNGIRAYHSYIILLLLIMAFTPFAIAGETNLQLGETATFSESHGVLAIKVVNFNPTTGIVTIEETNLGKNSFSYNPTIYIIDKNGDAHHSKDLQWSSVGMVTTSPNEVNRRLINIYDEFNLGGDILKGKLILDFSNYGQKAFWIIQDSSVSAEQTTIITPTKVPTSTQTLTPTPTSNPALNLSANGSINVKSSPPISKVYLNSVFQSYTPTILYNLAPGTYTVTVRSAGYNEWSQNVAVTAGRTTSVTASLVLAPEETTAIVTALKTTVSNQAHITSQASPPSPGIDLAEYTSIILIVVVIIVIAGAGIYMVKAQKASSHLRVPEPQKRSPTIKSRPPQSQSKSSSPTKTVDPKFIQPETPKQLPQELSDRYTNFELIGKGGFARVFKATRTDGKQVALKIPISLDSSTGKTFIAELQNWTKLDHPNIVRVFDYNIMPLPYFEMELCDSSLAEREKPIESEEAAWILFNVCEGLKFTHARKIIHRDLKPQNILLNKGVPKISDWGLSRVITESTSTTAGSFTPYYAAPEQISSNQKDERTDIWQLGVIFYELVTGQLPFTGDSIVAVMAGIATKYPQTPSSLNLSSHDVESMIMKCLEKNPGKRYQSVLELQKDLALYLRITYTESLKMSVTANDPRRSAFYCGDLVMVNILTGDMKSAYKYLLDLVHYSKGDVKVEAQELSEQIKMRMEMGLTEIPDELIQKAEFIVHQVSVGFRK